jgi:hypothetical protein
MAEVYIALPTGWILNMNGHIRMAKEKGVLMWNGGSLGSAPVQLTFGRFDSMPINVVA